MSDRVLEEKLRAAVSDIPVAETRMFGGVCFTLNGNMLAGIFRDEAFFRVGKDAHADALARPHARPMIMAGRPAKGSVLVDRAGLAGDGLKSWLDLALAYVNALPAKQGKAAARRKKSP
jgi:TfoX/Sxy family transcriptional regulator of competence genes